jgi:hypothetical protein
VAWLRLESSTSMMSRVFLVQRKNRKKVTIKKTRACFPTLDVGHPGPNSRKLPPSATNRRWKNVLEVFQHFELSPLEEESLLQLMYGGPESESEPDA